MNGWGRRPGRNSETCCDLGGRRRRIQPTRRHRQGGRERMRRFKD